MDLLSRAWLSRYRLTPDPSWRLGVQRGSDLEGSETWVVHRWCFLDTPSTPRPFLKLIKQILRLHLPRWTGRPQDDFSVSSGRH